MRLPWKIVRRLPDHHYVPRIYGRSAGKMRDIRHDERFMRAADPVVKGEPRRSLLYYDRLHTLYQAFENACRLSDVGPHMAEIGVFRGGGSAFLASLAVAFDRPEATLVSLDTFEGHAGADLPTGREAVHVPGTFGDRTSYDDVRDYLSAYPFVNVVQGRVQDRTEAIGRNDYGLVHLDVDLYQPMRFGLDWFIQRMASGGTIVVDDHGFTTCPGVAQAVDEALSVATRPVAKFALLTGQCVLVVV